MITRRVRFPRPRKLPEQVIPISPAPEVVQRDDGMFQIGWHDEAAGPFESRTFAQAVALGLSVSEQSNLPR